ncbi:MAG: ATP-grasp domain-containing protein [Firmicutes bacterium]|nr:ATP-grasp domain-containing protein [Bacillota bacterium]
MNIAITFGGKSVEHDVSILTGLHASRNVMDGVGVYLVYLTRGNGMLTGSALSSIDYYINGRGKAHECMFSNDVLYKRGGFGFKQVAKIDAVLNCCHGGIGENGELAGFFASLGVPVTSSDSFAASAMMSKSFTRELFSKKGKDKFDQPKYMAFKKSDIKDGIEELCKQVTKKIGFPIIVKPDTLGSSIGITVVHNEDELVQGVELAFTLDNTIVVEEFLKNAVEINCAAFRSGNEIFVSVCEHLDKESQFLDFDKKYLQQGGFIKKIGKQREEEVDQGLNDIFKEIQKMTKRAYEKFGASGVVRFDYLVTGYNSKRAETKLGQEQLGKKDVILSEAVGRDSIKIYLNEANSVPGFLSYHLWHRGGIPYGLLVDMLVKQAIQDYEAHDIVKSSFKSEILTKNRGLVE